MITIGYFCPKMRTCIIVLFVLGVILFLSLFFAIGYPAYQRIQLYQGTDFTVSSIVLHRRYGTFADCDGCVSLSDLTEIPRCSSLIDQYNSYSVDACEAGGDCPQPTICDNGQCCRDYACRGIVVVVVAPVHSCTKKCVAPVAHQNCTMSSSIIYGATVTEDYVVSTIGYSYTYSLDFFSSQSYHEFYNRTMGLVTIRYYNRNNLRDVKDTNKLADNEIAAITFAALGALFILAAFVLSIIRCVWWLPVVVAPEPERTLNLTPVSAPVPSAPPAPMPTLEPIETAETVVVV